MLFDLKVLSDGAPKTIRFDNQKNEFIDLNTGNVFMKKTRCTDYLRQNKMYNIDPENIGGLYITLGLNCNFSCKYCHQNPFRDSTEVVPCTPEKVEGLIDILRKARLKPKFIALWGGEPLVFWKSLNRLIPKLRVLYPDTNINFPTNGALLTNEITQFLDEYKVNFYISYDGKTGNRDFSILDNEKVVHALQNRRRGISIMPTQNKASIPIADIRREFDVLGLKLDAVSPYSIARCNPYTRDQALEIEIPADKCRRHSDFLYRVLHGEEPDQHLYQGLHDRFNHFASVLWRGLGPDSADVVFCNNSTGRDVCIDCEGKVFNCMNIPKHVMGNILDFKPINSEGIYQNHLTKKTCLECPFISACRGGCPLIHDDQSIEFKVNCNNLKIIAVPFFRTAIERLLGVYLKQIIRVSDGKIMGTY